MARNPDKDILRKPTPTAGASKQSVDAVLTALKIGNGVLSLLAGLLASVLILYSGYVLYDSFSTEYMAYTSAWDLLRYKPVVLSAGEPSDGAEKMAAINEDYRAWLTIYDTTIDYPVVQGPDDLYYAAHDIYRNSSLTGAIYLAAQSSGDFRDSYNLLYGHHMDNGAMFGSLDKFKDSAYFHSHQTGIIATESGIYDITFFATVSTDAYEREIYGMGDRAEGVISFLTGDRSNDAGVGTEVLIYDKEAAKGATKIIALSTCADAQTNGRLVVFGKMTLRETETPTPTAGETATPTIPATETVTPTPTAGETATPTNTASETATPTPTARETATPTNTATETTTPAPTVTATKTTPIPTGATTTPTPTTATTTPTPTPKPTRSGGGGGGAAMPTATVPPGVTLKVHYMLDGEEIFPTAVIHYGYKDSYYAVSPQKPGYEAEIEIVRGTITEDMEVYVRYTPKAYRVTVRYIFPDGTEAAPSGEAFVQAGDNYGMYSPAIEGYRATRLKITGTSTGRDEQYTVIYLPADEGAALITIDDYETATFLGITNIQIGICYE